MPDAIIVEDVTFTHLPHCEAVDFMFVIVGYDHFASLGPAAAQ
jgi:hypothetical protein